jgi:hypothetical protein
VLLYATLIPIPRNGSNNKMEEQNEREREKGKGGRGRRDVTGARKEGRKAGRNVGKGYRISKRTAGQPRQCQELAWVLIA